VIAAINEWLRLTEDPDSGLPNRPAVAIGNALVWGFWTTAGRDATRQYAEVVRVRAEAAAISTELSDPLANDPQRRARGRRCGQRNRRRGVRVLSVSGVFTPSTCAGAQPSLRLQPSQVGSR
jgi:hypothetical protein